MFRCAWIFALVASGLGFGAPQSQVIISRVPDGGLQPQTAVGADGIVHLVYFKGDPAHGDLFYAHSRDGVTFSKAIRVNSTPGAAVAAGDVRGARLAIGRRGQVFIVWNGSGETAPDMRKVPMLFARLNNQGTGFEPQRNLIHTAYGLDGGGAVVADGKGAVYVFWHAPVPGREGEAARHVWISKSIDDGKTFDRERVAWDEATGACGCCSLQAGLDARGTLFVLFRSARELIHRDMYLLESTDRGRTFHGTNISSWQASACVMSTAAIASRANATYAAWEAKEQVHYGLIDAKRTTVQDLAVPSGPKEKHPSLALNSQGNVLMAWTQNVESRHGGALRWQILDSAGQRVGTVGFHDGVPALDLVSAVARPDGSFVILY